MRITSCPRYQFFILSTHHPDNTIDRYYQLWAIVTGLILSFIAATYYLLTARNTQSKSTLQEQSDENQQLREIWQTFDKCSTAIIAIQIYTLEHDENKITEIGLSAWPIKNGTNMKTFCWQVRENIEPVAYNSAAEIPDMFAFGETRLVHERNIGPLIDGFLKYWLTQYERVCLVGHGITRVLDPLSRHWKLPDQILVLDTQRIWQQQTEQIDELDLEECLRRLPIPELDCSLLGNAGNDSRCIAYILESLGSLAYLYRGTARHNPYRK